MSEQQGWIKAYRKIVDWEWYTDGNVFRVFMHILLTANHIPKQWRGITVNTGELVTSIGSLANQIKLSERQIRTALDKLEKTGEIKRKSTNKNTVIIAVNYELYQGLSYEERQTNDKQATNGRQTNDKQMTTNNNDKNVKNDKNVNNIRHKYGKFKNVLLTDEELEKLKSKFPNSWEKRIETLSTGIELKGYKYKSHYLAILKWAERDNKAGDREYTEFWSDE